MAFDYVSCEPQLFTESDLTSQYASLVELRGLVHAHCPLLPPLCDFIVDYGAQHFTALQTAIVYPAVRNLPARSQFQPRNLRGYANVVGVCTPDGQPSFLVNGDCGSVSVPLHSAKARTLFQERVALLPSGHILARQDAGMVVYSPDVTQSRPIKLIPPPDADSRHIYGLIGFGSKERPAALVVMGPAAVYVFSGIDRLFTNSPSPLLPNDHCEIEADGTICFRPLHSAPVFETAPGSLCSFGDYAWNYLQGRLTVFSCDPNIPPVQLNPPDCVMFEHFEAYPTGLPSSADAPLAGIQFLLQRGSYVSRFDPSTNIAAEFDSFRGPSSFTVLEPQPGVALLAITRDRFLEVILRSAAGSSSESTASVLELWDLPPSKCLLQWSLEDQLSRLGCHLPGLSIQAQFFLDPLSNDLVGALTLWDPSTLSDGVEKRRVFVSWKWLYSR